LSLVIRHCAVMLKLENSNPFVCVIRVLAGQTFVLNSCSFSKACSGVS